MTREQIRYWAQEGIEFGSHTRTRADLTMLDSSALESEIGGECRRSACDFGRASRIVRTSVRPLLRFLTPRCRVNLPRSFHLRGGAERPHHGLVSGNHRDPIRGRMDRTA